MENLIEARGLTKRYGDFALREVDLTVPEGAVVGLVGENGAGKTTLLRLILGLARPDGGQIRLMGGDPKDARSREPVAAVFEDSFFYKDMNIRRIDRVMRGTVAGWDSARFAELARAFQLDEAQPVKEYSRGMRMKANLAVALARRPRLMILDEPTSGLDPVMRGEMLDIFLDFMQDERCSILISSHITSDLEQIADQIAYLHEGEMLFQRDKLELMEDMAVVRCPKERLNELPRELIIARREGPMGAEALVRDPSRVRALLPGAVVDAASIDEMMRLYARRDER